MVVYRGDGEGPCAVSVSASSKRAAILRLKDNRPADVIHAEIILGRKPEYDQDRIEGTIDMSDPVKAVPPAGSREAERVRESNANIIRQWMVRRDDERQIHSGR